MNTNKVNELNELCIALDSINSQYPRRDGSMVMIDPDMEDQIEGILNQMEDLRGELTEITDSEIEEFTDDISGFREYIVNLAEVIQTNREEVEAARAFLCRYMSR